MDISHNKFLAALSDFGDEARLLTDKLRTRALLQMKVLDSPPEIVFNDILLVLSRVCNIESAILTFIDERRVYVKGATKFQIGDYPRETSFCNVGIQQPEKLMIVTDARLDSRFEKYPLVESNDVLFYAGGVIKSLEGYPVGMLCVCDTTPRQLNENQLLMLEKLTDVVSYIVQTRQRIVLHDNVAI